MRSVKCAGVLRFTDIGRSEGGPRGASTSAPVSRAYCEPLTVCVRNCPWRAGDIRQRRWVSPRLRAYYLRGFAALDEKTDKFVWLYRKIPGNRPKRVSVKSVAWKSFYYEQETTEGTNDTDTVEARFAKATGVVATTSTSSLRLSSSARRVGTRS